MDEAGPQITNDAVVSGFLAVTLGAILYSARSENTFFKSFYKYVPAT